MRGLAVFASLGASLALGLDVPRSSVDARIAVADPNIPSPSAWVERAGREDRRLCILEPDADGGDDAPALLAALNNRCRTRSIVVLPGPVYHIKSPMVTTELDDVVIDQRGKLLWSNDTSYWLSVSMPVGFQNQSTVWHFGGDRVVWEGHGVGTLDGNGQVWYDLNKGGSNMPRRPMNVNFWGLSNSVVRGLRFVQSQMWTMNIMHSKNLVFEDIYVNSTSSTENNSLNTDGADTMYSDNITFRRWVVVNGDDAIAVKANSSNIHVYDSEFFGSTGIAMGSIGQFAGQFEYIENVFARNVTLHDTLRACYFKTWTGVQIGYPPNGGGGGTGYARNIVLEDVTLDGARGEPLFITQCESYSGHAGESCDTSTFAISDVVWRGIRGTVADGVASAGFFRCSAAAGGCGNLTVEDFAVKPVGRDRDGVLNTWLCENVHGGQGFACREIEDADTETDTGAEEEL
ncbi:Putative glycoside hydrolase, family 28, pectin lyase/virulence factor [Colletotrichum destructivum]|uniref:Glycoside hydrolase, family 28, pectin lyase/virulence factor n=1 Tax=Colletotrichum destructivum TaxID=34406 RepID=A0AAX4IVH2_9PEZI|nr:Putative glycoside hydrolase, family 28, pectin lyase/virulence factor [Colletotrichum destructivum]